MIMSIPTESLRELVLGRGSRGAAARSEKDDVPGCGGAGPGGICASGFRRREGGVLYEFEEEVG